MFDKTKYKQLLHKGFCVRSYYARVVSQQFCLYLDVTNIT